MITRTLTKHATGEIIKISLMMNIWAGVIPSCRIRARATGLAPRGNMPQDNAGLQKEALAILRPQQRPYGSASQGARAA
jgi:hypothetical protein